MNIITCICLDVRDMVRWWQARYVQDLSMGDLYHVASANLRVIYLLICNHRNERQVAYSAEWE